MGQLDHAEILQLLKDLSKGQEMLSARQQKLLEAIETNDADEEAIRQETEALSALMMAMLERLQRALRR